MLPAAISPIQARQQFENKSVGVDATHLIKIRGLESIDEKNDRFLFGTRVFEILAVEDIQERGVVKVITCKEVR
jgi:head-tail adaptor